MPFTYSRKKSTKIKDGAYVINLDKYKVIGTHWIALYINSDNVMLALSIICGKCGKDKEIFKEEESVDILRISEKKHK